MGKDELIKEFTKLLLKQELEDEKTKKPKYVKKTRIYKDVIYLLKNYIE
nr:MAG TPA: hypothetical protein [Caudoviricetes sp.]